MTKQEALELERLHQEAIEEKERLVHAQKRYSKAEALFANALAKLQKDESGAGNK